ncbi:MAG: hypothetical protein GEV06_00845 [Luteitalea sp.]|nr:hypothetical protein [Luteitalea sp.]
MTDAPDNDKSAQSRPDEQSSPTGQSAQKPAQKPAQTPGTEQAAGDASPEAEPVKPVPAELPAIVARVNGEAIGKADLERAIHNMEASSGQKLPAGERDRVYRGVLDQLIAFELLSQEAQSRKLTVTDKEVQARVETLRKQFPDESAFLTALKQRQLSPADLEAETRRELVADKVLQQAVDPKVSLGPQEAATFYKENPERFRTPEQLRASHILIKVDPKADQSTKQAARVRATDLREQLEKGADFAALARKHSEDGSASSGGDLDYFPRGQMVKPFEDAAFALDVGQLSDVVETPFGYHIIKVTDHKAAALMPLDDTLQGRIEEVLQMGRRRELAVQLVQALRAKGKVEVFI